METLRAILPEPIRQAIKHIPFDQVYELRLRANAPVVACVDGRNFSLPADVTCEDLENIVHKAAEYAIYAVLDQMVKGFITIRGGVRIGIAGELVTDRGQVVAIKNLSSLCIRIPHEVKNCACAVVPYVFALNRPVTTLLVAPPGAGKTTLLRDLARQIGTKYPTLNTLLLDERGELAACYQGEKQLDVGQNCDVITGGTKAFGFENGIRSLRPDVIITDEIATADDVAMLKRAVRSGVVVIASVHAADLGEVRAKPDLGVLVEQGVFERYVVLRMGEHAGEVVGIYDRALRHL
ncbi:MAG: Flp pilus assembly complex ATPase component TadA [Eubacteriales bacterium]|nr:Flp pilus assembly complex ATPase component TadA [Eubacteriales bacterium]